MSHLGMKILYSLINQRADYWCERVFAPGIDFEKLMRENRIPLYALDVYKRQVSVLFIFLFSADKNRLLFINSKHEPQEFKPQF